MSSNTEELVVKVTIYTHTHAQFTQTHYTVIQLCTHTSVCPVFSVVSQVTVSPSLTQTETNWGEGMVFFFFFFWGFMRLSQVICLPKGIVGKVGPS